MKRRIWLLCALVTLLWATPAVAGTRFIVHSSLSVLTTFCAVPLQTCTVANIDGGLNQVFLLTTPTVVNDTTFLGLLRNTVGVVNAEVDLLVNLVGGPPLVPAPAILSTLITDRTSVSYAGTMVWNSYVNQPASIKVRVQEAQTTFAVLGKGIVADIDTGVDPNHPALQSSLLLGYDFTRNRADGSEMTDFTSTWPTSCPTCQPARVNQSSAAILDQSSAAILDGSPQYKAFGHGTMVMGVIHLVAPNAKLLPLKAFSSDGTGYLSDILRAIYYAAQNNANAINMSFNFTANSQELVNALDYVNRLGVICVASSGNDAQQGPPNLVYPAALQTVAMGVASTSNSDGRSSFSNYGNAIVWVAAPGEAIVTTYPFSTYSAGWGTSFSAPFVSGGASLLRTWQASINHAQAAAAIGAAAALDPTLGLGHGRLDLVLALRVMQASGPPDSSGPPDFSVSAGPARASVNAGDVARFTASATPSGGFSQTIIWNCTGAPAGATCVVSPSSTPMDGSNSVTANVTLSTTARASVYPSPQPQAIPPGISNLVMAGFAWLFVVVMFLILSWPHRKHLWISGGIAIIVILCVSCGGGSTSPGPQPPGGTPAGSYTVTVTGTSGSLSHSAAVNVTVN